MFLICRFGSKHITDEGFNIVNETRYEEWKSNPKLHTVNSLKYDVQEKLRKRTYDFSKTNQVISKWNKERKEESEHVGGNDEIGINDKNEVETDQIVDAADTGNSPPTITEPKAETNGSIAPVLDFAEVKLRKAEKKKVKLNYLKNKYF